MVAATRSVVGTDFGADILLLRRLGRKIAPCFGFAGPAAAVYGGGRLYPSAWPRIAFAGLRPARGAAFRPGQAGETLALGALGRDPTRPRDYPAEACAALSRRADEGACWTP